MVRRVAKRFGLAVSVAAVVLSLSSSAVMAGEVTGSGKNVDQNQGKSWCSFSGLNDRNEGEGPTDTQAQSYGQDVAAGSADPHVANPGFFCNPNHTPLPPNPNRSH
jgi:hypothetical protein